MKGRSVLAKKKERRPGGRHARERCDTGAMLTRQSKAAQGGQRKMIRRPDFGLGQDQRRAKHKREVKVCSKKVRTRAYELPGLVVRGERRSGRLVL